MGEGAHADLFVFDTKNQHWSAVDIAPDSPTPPPRSYHAMTASKDKIYVFGGCGQSGRMSDLWEFTPRSNTGSNSVGGSWRQLPSCDAVGARGGSVMVASADGRFLYVMGGFNGAEMADCHSYDIETHTWSCPTCCSPVDSAGTAEPHDHAGTCGSKTNSCMVMPLARSVFGAAVHGACDSAAQANGSCGHGGHIIAFGGEVCAGLTAC